MSNSSISGELENILPQLRAYSRSRLLNIDDADDLVSKTCAVQYGDIVVGGISKGSGMIQPNMATMLAFVFTDAKIPAPVLQKLVSDAADKSLNCVTVDGDTSTSDTLLMVASGVARHAPVEEADDPVLVDFKRALDEVLAPHATAARVRVAARLQRRCARWRWTRRRAPTSSWSSQRGRTSTSSRAYATRRRFLSRHTR